MKIECPECGQHYEVDSSMLDRHFRCTECKTFFLGLNAKVVRTQKFVPRNSAEDQLKATTPDITPAADLPEDIKPENNTVETEKKSVPVVKLAVGTENKKSVTVQAVAAVKTDGDKNDGSDTGADNGVSSADEEGMNPEQPVKITRFENVEENSVPIAVVAFNRFLAVAGILLGVIAVGLFIFQNSQLNKLNKENRQLRQAGDDMKVKLDLIAALTDKLQKSHEELESLRSDVARLRDDTTLKQKCDEVAQSVKKQDEKLDGLQKNVDSLNNAIEDLSEKLKDRSSGRRGSQRNR